MSSSFHAPGWHGDAHTPVVDGKYYDRKTGKIKTATDGDDHQKYGGPPAVDIVIGSLHDETSHCLFLAARQFPMEALLVHIMKLVGERQLELDSVMATTYSIRVVLADERLSPEEFAELALEMANGLFDE